MEKSPKPERKGYRGLALAAGAFVIGLATKQQEFAWLGIMYGSYKLNQIIDPIGRVRQSTWEDMTKTIGYTASKTTAPVHSETNLDPVPESNVENSEPDMDTLMREIGEELDRHPHEGETPL